MAKRTNKQPLKLLRSRQEYDTALEEIEGYCGPKQDGSPRWAVRSKGGTS